MSKLDALRAAQLWLLNHPEAILGSRPEATRGARRLDQGEQKSKRSSPRLWAAFVLGGDWR